jgi:hypothetical protein
MSTQIQLPPSLTSSAKGALALLRAAQETFAKARGVDRRRSDVKHIKMLLNIAAETLEQGIGAA